MAHDDLGKRIKENYELRTQVLLSRRTYTIIRLDGVAFHTFVREENLTKPFSDSLVHAMDMTAIYLCENVQGCKLAYVQSDEITLVLTDFDNIGTQAWFDGNVQKICSVSASMATHSFRRFFEREAFFDARVFTIADRVEVVNMLIWRQKDAIRNSIQMVARANFSHNELQNLNTNHLQEKLFQERGINWNDTRPEFKRGRMILKFTVNDTERTCWMSSAAPEFTTSWDLLYLIIPSIEEAHNK